MPRRGWLRPALAVLLAAGLVACGGGGGTSDPSLSPSLTMPPSSATPSPTPSSSPLRTGPLTTGAGVAPDEKPPVMNTLAKEHSRLGAVAFAVYFIKALDWSKATSDPYLLQSISSSACVSCKTDINNLIALRAKRGYLRSGRLKIDSSQILQDHADIRADYTIKFVLTQAPVVVVTPAATTTQIPTAKTFASYVYVSWIGHRWLTVERAAG